MKIKEITSTSITFYIGMAIIGTFFMFLYVMFSYFECFRIFVSTSVMKFIEFMAAGIFPSIFVAFFADVANTNRQKCYYEKFYNDSIKVLKSMCENLPTELHACIADIYQKENFSDEEWKKKKTFSEWCQILYDKKDQNQIRYIKQEVLHIKAEALKTLEKLSSYQAYRNEENNNAIKNLINGCDAFCRVVDEYGKYTGNHICHSQKLVQGILALFPIDLSENKYIKVGYLDKFNSDDYCE